MHSLVWWVSDASTQDSYVSSQDPRICIVSFLQMHPRREEHGVPTRVHRYLVYVLQKEGNPQRAALFDGRNSSLATTTPMSYRTKLWMMKRHKFHLERRDLWRWKPFRDRAHLLQTLWHEEHWSD